MKIEKFTISNDPEIYEAWPDVVLASAGKLICVFSECTHHGDRSYTRIMLSESDDRGHTWTKKHPLTEGTRGLKYYYNCARISRLRDGRLAIIVDKVPAAGESVSGNAVNVLYFSDDDGRNWSAPVETPLIGLVPDKLLELDTGRWIIAAHSPHRGRLTQFLRYSDDAGKTWSDPVIVASDPRYHLCEVSLLPLGGGVIAAFHRENSFLGYDCQKTLSFDNGETWGPVVDFPLPGCHRPVAGFLQDGSILITYRFMQGGKGWLGRWTQNFFGAVSDRESALAVRRNDAWTRIFPINYDPSSKADLGYSGWVQFPDGEIYVVNYIVDDAIDKSQIRGYSFSPDEIMLKEEKQMLTGRVSGFSP
ncbi:MAG: Sialidase A precursor [Lentisphaerae bacterium ADurb.Bin242]|nr:MAG: Sialidase A precursor [Lentisphaerae bacterium ADurb.Bin242]